MTIPVGEQVAIALGKKHPKEYNFKSLTRYTRSTGDEEDDDDKENVNQQATVGRHI